MFFDWLSCYQDHEQDLPFISRDGMAFFDTYTGLSLSVSLDGDRVFNGPNIRQRSLQHEGSFSTSINIKVSGRRVTVTGNPSRFNRLDNLFGYRTIDACFAVYNVILSSLGLPPFTRCEHKGFIEVERENGAVSLQPVMHGAHITELHITSNIAVGEGNTDAYLKAIASQPYRNSVPHLFPNGKTVEWKSKLGNARLMYPSYYEKLNEIELKTIPKVKRMYGEESDEYQYILDLCKYLKENGVIRCEQKLKSTFLNKNNLQYWGISDFSQLKPIHDEFINLDKKLKVSRMDLQTISETLLDRGIVETTRAANTTALYALNWMNGQKFDFSKSQVQTHRARLRQIGIDIAKPCNLLLFSPVIVKEVKEIERSQLTPPSFYRHPKTQLSLVA